MGVAGVNIHPRSPIGVGGGGGVHRAGISGGESFQERAREPLGCNS